MSGDVAGADAPTGEARRRPPCGNEPLRLSTARPADLPADLGRHEELSTVVGAIRQAALGEPSALLVEGEAGIGKTTLVDAALGRTASLGVPVYRAEAHEMESRRPFGVLSDALGVAGGASELQGHIAELLGAPARQRAQGTDVSAYLEFGIGEQLLALVDELTTTRPAVLVVEDLQWADPASLVVLYRLSRLRPPPPLLVVATLRPLPRRGELQELLSGWTARGARRLQLGPLPAPAGVALVERRLQAPVGPALERRLEGAGGNPLFLSEIADGLAGEGAVVIGPDGRADVGPGGWPSSLSLVVLGRIGYLAAPTRDLLGLASVLGTTFDLSDLSALTGLRVADCWARLEEAVTARLLDASGDGLTFRHDVIREALYDDLPPAVRMSMHRDAARALAARGAPAVAVAEHLVRGERTADPRSLSWLRRAAADEAPRAPAVAVELLGAALALAGLSPADRRELTADLGLALVASGRNRDGEAALREALEAEVDPHRRTELRARLTSSLLVRGDAARAEAEAEAALGSDGLSEVSRARFTAFLGFAALHLGHLAEADASGRRAETLARGVGDVPGQVQALCLRAQLAIRQGHPVEAVALAAPAVELAGAAQTSEAHEGLPDVMRVLALTDADRLEEAEAAMEAGRRRTEAFATPASTVIDYISASYAHLWSGRWDAVLADLDAAAALTADDSSEWATELLCPRALIACWRGRTGEARAWLGHLESRQRDDLTQLYVGWPDWVRAACCEAAGEPDAALDAQARAWEAATAIGMAFEYRILGPPLARRAADAGRPGTSREVAGELEVLARASPGVPGLAGAALRCRALAEDDPDAHVEALAAFRAGARLPERAWCAEDAAVALSRAGRGEEAAEVARESLSLYADLEAEGEAVRARATWRRAGLRLGARGLRRRPRTGWAALTPTEVRVATLVAARLSNPEIARTMFVSRHTVATHVSHLLAKLDMTTRADLVAAAARGPLEQLGQVPQQS